MINLNDLMHIETAVNTQYSMNLPDSLDESFELIESTVQTARNEYYDSYTLYEGVVGVAKKGVNKFFELLSNATKSIRAKLSEFLNRSTLQTDKWLNQVRPLVSRANGPYNYEINKWDSNYILNTLPRAFDSVFSLTVENTRFYNNFNSLYDNSFSVTNANVASSTSRKMNDLITTLTKYNTDFKGKVNQKLSSSCGVQLKDDMKDILDEITIKAMGKRETVNIQPLINSVMIPAVTRYTNSMKDIIKSYDDLIKTLNDMQKKCDEVNNKSMNASVKAAQATPEDNKALAELANTRVKLLNTTMDGTVDQYTVLTNAINSLRKVNINLLRSMVKEYMNAINAYTHNNTGNNPANNQTVKQAARKAPAKKAQPAQKQNNAPVQNNNQQAQQNNNATNNGNQGTNQ